LSNAYAYVDVDVGMITIKNSLFFKKATLSLQSKNRWFGGIPNTGVLWPAAAAKRASMHVGLSCLWGMTLHDC